MNVWDGGDGAVVRALASHQRGLGSILGPGGPGVICGLNLLLVFVLALRVFVRPQNRYNEIHYRV